MIFTLHTEDGNQGCSNPGSWATDTLTPLILKQADEWLQCQESGELRDDASLHITMRYDNGSDAVPAGELVIRPLFGEERCFLQVEVRYHRNDRLSDTKVLCPYPPYSSNLWYAIGVSEGFALGILPRW